MSRIHVQTPNAMAMNDAIDKAFASFECEPLGGASADGWSKMNDLQRCQYRYYLKHELQAEAIDPMDFNIRIPTPAPLEVGGLFHAVLALHYGRRLPEGYPGWRPNMPNPIDFLDRVEGYNCELAHVQLVRRLYYGYSEFYGPEFDVQPVAVEFPAGQAGVHTCRYDTLVHKDGALKNLEHKCLPGAAEVLTDVGPVRVGALAGMPHATLRAFNKKTGDFTWAPSRKGFVPTGMQDVYRMRTTHGWVCNTGYRHPYWTKRGWVRAADLQPGDQVAVGLDAPTFRAGVEFSRGQAFLFGALIADGSLARINPHYTKACPDKRAAILDGLAEFGNAARERNPPHRCAYVAIRKGPVTDLLVAWGLNVKSAKKHIPTALRTMELGPTGALLGGLFSGDGSLTVYTEKRKNGTQTEKVRICYGSRSRRLCVHIAQLLARFGVAATVTDTSVQYKGARRAYHYATVIGSAMKRKFCELVLAEQIVGPGLVAAAQKCLRGLDAVKVQGRGRSSAVVEGNLWWQTVDTVLCTGREFTYDAEVEELHTMVVDGFVTHNTATRDTPDVSENWWLDGEIVGQHYVYQKFGLDKLFGPLTSTIINITFKTIPVRFKRIEIVVPQDVIDAYAADRSHWNDVRNHCRNSNHWPRSLQGCVSRYDRCGYWNHCRDMNPQLLEIRRAENRSAP